jgi:hypothetical protein
MIDVRRFAAALLCCTLIAGCAGNRAPATQPMAPGSNAAVIEYVRQIPLGTNVRIDRASEGAIKGTLLKVGEQTLVVQPRTRIAVPPVEIPLADVTRVGVENAGSGTSLAKAIGAGIAAGAAGAAAVILILVAVLD